MYFLKFSESFKLKPHSQPSILTRTMGQNTKFCISVKDLSCSEGALQCAGASSNLPHHVFVCKLSSLSQRGLEVGGVHGTAPTSLLGIECLHVLELTSHPGIVFHSFWLIFFDVHNAGCVQLPFKWLCKSKTIPAFEKHRFCSFSLVLNHRDSLCFRVIKKPPS